MVLQAQKPILIWGWANPNETVTVQLASETKTVQANAQGEWKAELPQMNYGGPFVLSVKGSSSLQFDDVMIGEVWLCSGQSNMEMGIQMVRDSTNEIAAANYPGIRLFKIKREWSPVPKTNFDGTWKVCSPQTIIEGGWNGFSAAGYFFGRELHKKLGVTVGLIDATWGGTRIESWTPPEGFAEVPTLAKDWERVQLGDPHSTLHRERLDKTLEEVRQWLAVTEKAEMEQMVAPAMPTFPKELSPPSDLQNPTALYNGMIHPLAPFGLRGAIWYQGEANYGEGKLYTERMKALVGGWRAVWKEGDFPFYFAQIAPFNYGGNPETMGEFWEAQTLAADTITNCGVAVINDIGNLSNIHPTNKQEVGRRLSLLALAKTYGVEKVEFSGPTFKAMSIEGNKLRVSFDHADGQLKSGDGKPLDWFELIDADEGGYVKADASIEGSDIVLTSPEVKHPVAMRFAWNMLAEPNLVNAEGLPAGAFRAGNVPARDWVTTHVKEIKDYQLVYEVDLAKLGTNIVYTVDNHANIHQPFDRIAYVLDLQTNNDSQSVYVSMDAFTSDLSKIGVPTLKSAAHFQEPLANLNVFSNKKGIVNGTGLAGGNLEFWPYNYGPDNGANVPNASSEVFDFGDKMADEGNYGSMQIHNHDAKQTVFALNNWNAGAHADLGMGNQPAGNPDWTFAGNAGTYQSKRLRIYVRCKP
jgi:sialate O-acetylesterase